MSKGTSTAAVAAGKTKLPAPTAIATATPAQAIPAGGAEQAAPMQPQIFSVSGDIPERSIDIRGIAFIQCLFQSQFFASSSQPKAEAYYSVGSGALISPDGYIITARHVLEPDKALANDPAGRVWTRQECHALPADEAQTPVPEPKYWTNSALAKFKKADVVFKASDAEYADTLGSDIAILKIEAPEPLPYFPIYPQLIKFDSGNKLVVIGYPGMESGKAQSLERFDGTFNTLTFFERNTACNAVTLAPCGWRYWIRRYSYDYEKDFYTPTPLGIVSGFNRAGFSGSPAFYKGNFVGIATHRDPGDTGLGWEGTYVLTSYDILDVLHKNNIGIQNTPR